jgi:hypothetical protein
MAAYQSAIKDTSPVLMAGFFFSKKIKYCAKDKHPMCPIVRDAYMRLIASKTPGGFGDM